MPERDTPLHMDMLDESYRNGQIARDGVYGMHWGDPQTVQRVRKVRDAFLLPYVHPDRVAIEIGPGGGRWTRYLLGFGKVYAVDYHQRMLDELARAFRAPHLVLVKNNGADFPGIPPASVHFIFSWAAFVHFELPLISDYLTSMKQVLVPGGQVVLNYSDKTKEKAREHGENFGDNDPERMGAAVRAAGFEIVEEDRELILNSSAMRFQLPQK